MASAGTEKLDATAIRNTSVSVFLANEGAEIRVKQRIVNKILERIKLKYHSLGWVLQ